jgi:predicted nucleic-acid-binding protein
VLERAYGFAGAALAAAIERVLQADALEVESEHQVFVTMVALKEERGSFADALVGALGEKAGCTKTLTFDRKALHLPSFEAL